MMSSSVRHRGCRIAALKTLPTTSLFMAVLVVLLLQGTTSQHSETRGTHGALPVFFLMAGAQTEGSTEDASTIPSPPSPQQEMASGFSLSKSTHVDANETTAAAKTEEKLSTFPTVAGWIQFVDVTAEPSGDHRKTNHPAKGESISVLPFEQLQYLLLRIKAQSPTHAHPRLLEMREMPLSGLFQFHLPSHLTASQLLLEVAAPTPTKAHTGSQKTHRSWEVVPERSVLRASVAESGKREARGPLLQIAVRRPLAEQLQPGERVVLPLRGARVGPTSSSSSSRSGRFGWADAASSQQPMSLDQRVMRVSGGAVVLALLYCSRPYLLQLLEISLRPNTTKSRKYR